MTETLKAALKELARDMIWGFGMAGVIILVVYIW